MHQFLIIARTLIFRLAYVLIAGMCIGLAVLATLWGMGALGNTAYRFVLLFIMIILVSNVLAKLAIAYIKA